VIAPTPFSRRPSVESSQPRSKLSEIESKSLLRHWPAFYEEIVLALTPQGSFWRERADPDAALAIALESDLAPRASDGARERACAALGEDPAVLRAFQEACEELIEQELDRNGESGSSSSRSTSCISFRRRGGIVIFKTGGFGADIAVAGAGTLSSLMAEKSRSCSDRRSRATRASAGRSCAARVLRKSSPRPRCRRPS
jgi:hypothetical protein